MSLNEIKDFKNEPQISSTGIEGLKGHLCLHWKWKSSKEIQTLMLIYGRSINSNLNPLNFKYNLWFKGFERFHIKISHKYKKKNWHSNNNKYPRTSALTTWQCGALLPYWFDHNNSNIDNKRNNSKKNRTKIKIQFTILMAVYMTVYFLWLLFYSFFCACDLTRGHNKLSFEGTLTKNGDDLVSRTQLWK